MNKYQAVCLDLDGTLFGKDSTISQKNKEVLKACLDKGIQVYFVSGRPYFFTKYQASLVDERVQVISSNGGCYDKGDTIVKKCIPQKCLAEIIDCLKETKSPAFFKSKDTIYAHEDYDARFMYDEWRELPQFPYTKSYPNLSWEELKDKTKDIVKILIYDTDKVLLRKLRQRIEGIDGITVASYNEISFDVNAANVNKGNAIKDVMEYRKIPLANVLAIGDGENDMAMFAVAGHTIAMCNAKASIQKLCDEVSALSNEDDGVSEILQEYFLRQ